MCVHACVRARQQTHLAEPVPEGRGASEDGGFLHFVAALRGNEAGDALDVPPAVGTSAVQGPPGVSLRGAARGRGER